MSKLSSITTIIACALPCEAKPVIDFYKLKKQSNVSAFDVYQAGSIYLIVSGIGQHNMSAAIHWIAGLLNSQISSNLLWLNLGIAGHPNAKVGQLFCCHHITDLQNSKHYYPSKWLKHKIPLEPLITLNHVDHEYLEKCLIDMEGSAFYQSATRFASNEQVQCLKVVSDNLKQAAHQNKAIISSLIADHMPTIDQFIGQHNEALSCLKLDQAITQVEQHLLNQTHFSFSQAILLKQKITTLFSQQIDFQQLDIHKDCSAKNILNQLSMLIEQQAVHI